MVHCNCGSDIIIKYGKTAAGRQRFKCTECGKTLTEDREIYTKTEKRLLSMFLNFLDVKSDEKYDLKEFVKRSREEYHHGSGKITIEQAHDVKKFNVDTAKVIICKDGDIISFYQIKENVLVEVLKIIRRSIAMRPFAVVSARKRRKINEKFMLRSTVNQSYDYR